MSVSIRFDNVVKRFGDNTVIPGLSLTIDDGEFFTLLGPSGSGKTTLLRMAAGFNTIEGGEIYFNDVEVSTVPPSKRNIGMVFQNYAVFPHMNVERNIAFGLKNRKLPKDEIEKRVKDIMEVVEISEYNKRMPDELSGGQQQRVALARAIVIEPDVLLMDEPLSNLDARLRINMRNAIKEIHERVNITTVYVTHDQEEAMAVSDRLAILDYGVIQQIGTPQEIYHRPSNQFVSTFIGNTNIVKGKLNGEKLTIGSYSIDVPTLDNGKVSQLVDASGDVSVSIRPEEFIINDKSPEGVGAKVIRSQFLGLNTHYFVELETGETAEIIMESSLEGILAPGEDIHLGIKAEKINLFTKDGSTTLVRSGAK